MWPLTTADSSAQRVPERPATSVVDKGTFPWGIDSGDAIDQTLSSICDAIDLGLGSDDRSSCANCCAFNAVIAGLIDSDVMTPAQLVGFLFKPPEKQ